MDEMDEPRRLPQPATNADEYLYDIAMSLRQVVGLLAIAAVPSFMKHQPAADGEVELKEPKPPKPKHRG